MNSSQRIGSFSDGMEVLESTSLHRYIGRFSEGMETLGSERTYLRVGRFSTGQELLAQSPSHIRVGRFSDGQAAPSGLVRTAFPGAEPEEELEAQKAA
jgi:hypothetical protein